MAGQVFWRTFAAVFAIAAVIVGLGLWAAASRSDQTNGATSGQSAQSQLATAAGAGEGDASSPGEASPTQVSPLTLAEFADSTYAVPSGCWSLVTTADTAPGEVAFEDGAAETEFSGALARIDGFASLQANGEQYAALGFSCTGGGTYYQAFWGVYDRDLNLLAEGNRTDVTAVAPVIVGASAGTFTGAGNTFESRIENILLGGDTGGGTGAATVTYQWNGTSAQVMDVIYELPTGSARMPDLDQVQEIYDLLAEDSPAAYEHIGTKVKNQIQFGFGDGSIPFSEVITPAGGTVKGCVLGGAIPEGGTRQDYVDDSGVYFPTVEYLEPGYFYCGINTLAVGGWSPSELDGKLSYSQWFMVRSDLEGTPFIYDVPRTFS